MRRFLTFFGFVCAIALLTAVSLAAPPPPPPPAPEDMARDLRGYDTSAIWSSYGYWIKTRMGAARSMVLEQRPASLDEDYYPYEVGPSARVINDEGGGEMYGRNDRIDRWCALNRPEPERCVWVARSARNTDTLDDIGFLRANFDLEAAVAFLERNGITPEQVRQGRPQSFGLPDPLALGPERYVSVREVTETQCEAVLEALETASALRERLEISNRRPRSVDSAPPPPPHSGLVEVILPAWYVQQRRGDQQFADAIVILSGRGPNTTAAEIAISIFSPIEECPRD